MKRYSLNEIDEILEDTAVNRFFDELEELDNLNFGESKKYEPTIETKIIRRNKDSNEEKNENFKSMSVNKYVDEINLAKLKTVPDDTSIDHQIFEKNHTIELPDIVEEKDFKSFEKTEKPELKRIQADNFKATDNSNTKVMIKNNPNEVAENQADVDDLIEATRKFFMQTQLFEEKIEKIREENKKMEKRQLSLTTVFICVILALVVALLVILAIILKR